MGYSWFLKLALNCIDHFAWPLLALGYPLCASVQAIETDSHSETRDLISYWILLSLIYLFEYAFLRFLSWFQYWPYLKLLIVFWLIIPDFGRASFVYSNLIRTCISMKPEPSMSKLKNWRKLFVKKENFLLHAERYIQENGTEALEELIASKITAHSRDAEATNTIRATNEKETQQVTAHSPETEETNTIRTTDEQETQQTNGEMVQTEQNDIKDLEVIEKEAISADKPKISSALMENNGMVGKDAAGGELPQSSTHKEVQKEWTCALCQLTTTSEKNLNSHLHGRKHKAACEALNAKNHPVPQRPKIDKSKEQSKQKNGFKGKVVIDHEKVQGMQRNLGKPVKMKKSKLRCEVCNVNCPGEVDMASHLRGKKHLAQIQTCS